MKKILLIALTILASQSHAKVKFSKKEIILKKIKLHVEVAETEEQHAQGLMFRKNLSESEGMLFVFPDEGTRSFWMKNTFIPLSIGFFNRKKVLIDIQDMKPTKSELETKIPVYTSAEPAMYALEVTQGWFTKKKIKVGDKLQIK